MKNIIIILIAIVIVGCNLPNRNHNKITIDKTNDSTKIVSAEIYFTDTISFVVDKNISDSIILSSIKYYSDSIKRDSLRRDSLQKVNFRIITRKINGGYNGYEDRVRLWNNAKKTLK